MGSRASESLQPVPSPAETKRAPTLRRALVSAAWLVLIGLAIHLLLPQIATLERSADVLRSLAWWALALAVTAQALSYAGNGYVTRALVALFGKSLTLARCIGIVMGSYSLSLLWGGQVMQTGATYRWLRQAGVPAEGALLSGVIPGFVNVFTIMVVSIFGLAYLLAAHDLSTPLATAFAMGLALLLCVSGAVVAGVRNRRWLRGMAHSATRLWSRLRRRPYDPAPADAAVGRLFDAWNLLVRGAWRRPVLGDALNVGFDILTLYLLFLAAHYTPNPGLVLAGYGLPLLAGKMAVLPGGLGVVEGGMVGLYEALGVPSGVVVVVILGYRLISFWVPALLGFLAALLLDRRAHSSSTS
jgi:uncharacterized membrane protein YbhN (UPF0104 family)